MGVREKGWSALAGQTENELRGIYVGAATAMFMALADRDDTSKGSGSPLASGHYSASMRIGINAADTSVARVDDAYEYPMPSKHLYNTGNLPRPTIPGVARTQVRAWLRGFKLGDRIHFSNSAEYAGVIEKGRRGKDGSWQKPMGVLLPTLDKLFQQKGWY